MFHFSTNKTMGVFSEKRFTSAIVTKAFLTTMVIFLMTIKIMAQQKTVEGSLQVLPPYPIQLQSYTNPLNDNVKLTVTLNGLWESGQTPVKLRLVIEKGNTIIAQSDNIGGLVGVTTTNLFPNVTYTFSSAEIAPYFALNNLQGINAATYNTPLTEGVYRLSFLVYNATTGKLISDAISQQFWVIQNEPPLLNTPRTGDNVKNELTTPINFQWIPRALQTVGRTEYEFTLVNISAANADNPYAQFLVKQQAPLFRRTVTTPAISVTPAELLLEAGKTYAWRVRARSLDFLNNDIASYKNDGYSDIFTFRYNGTCVKPIGLKLVAKSGDMIAASWTPNAKHLSYRVAYRKYVVGQNWKWLEQATANTFVNLTQLEPNTEYQVTVGGLCAENFLTYSDTLRIRTLDSSQIQGVTCGQLLPTDLSNRTPIASLAIGDSIKAGDFTVMITRIAGGAGNFTGQGYVKVPWMGDTKLKVNFNNISVNTDKKLIGGVIETAYDPDWGNVISVDKLLNSNFVLDVNIDGIISSVNVINGAGSTETKQIIIKDANGNILKNLPFGNNYIVTDKNGVQYSISRDGKVTKLPPKAGEPIKSINSGKPGLNNNQPIAADVPIVIFEKHQNNKYGFDYKTSTSAGAYEELPCPNCESGKYFVPWKSIATGDSVIIKAKLLANPQNTPIDSIQFRTDDGYKIYSFYEGNNTWRLHILGTLNDKLGSVYAIAPIIRNGQRKEEISGKINYITYDVKTHKIVLVPINSNGSSLDAVKLTEDLNKIFNQGILSLEVKKEANWNITNTAIYDNNKVLSLDHSLLRLYSPEQKAIITAYEKRVGQTDPNTTYLFILNKATEGVLGHTPIHKSYGFLFWGNGIINARVIAHELGHAQPCGLEHSFEENPITKGNTNNLMDYGNETELTYQQWKDIRDFRLRLDLIQKEEEGQFSNSGYRYFDNTTLNGGEVNNNVVISYPITPDGKPIKLSSNLTKVKALFGTNRYSNSFNLSQPDYKKLPFVVTSISKYDAINNTVINYNAEYSETEKKFLGYINAFDKEDILKETDYLLPNPPKSFIAELTLSIDDCIYRTINILNWETPTDGNVLTVQQKLNGQWANILSDKNVVTRTFAKHDLTNAGNIIANCASNGEEIGSSQQPSTANTIVQIESNLPNKEALIQKLQGLGFKYDSRSRSVYFDWILITDESTPKEKIDELEASVNKNIVANRDYRVLWIKTKTIDGKVTVADIKSYFSQDVDNQVRTILNTFVDYITFLANRNDLTQLVDKMTDALKALGEFISGAKISEKFYNPERTDYEAFPFYVYSAVQLTTDLITLNALFNGVDGKVGEVIVNGETRDITEYHKQFGFYCGLWNGVVDMVADIPNAGAFLIDVLTNKDNIRKDLLVKLNTIDDKVKSEYGGSYYQFIKNSVDQFLNGSNAAVNSHNYAYSVIQIVTSFMAAPRIAAKLGKIGKVLTILDAIDPSNLVFKIAGKPIKFILKEGANIIDISSKIILKPVIQNGKKVMRITFAAINASGTFVETFFIEVTKRTPRGVLTCGVPLTRENIEALASALGIGFEQAKIRFKEILQAKIDAVSGDDIKKVEDLVTEGGEEVVEISVKDEQGNIVKLYAKAVVNAADKAAAIFANRPNLEKKVKALGEVDAQKFIDDFADAEASLLNQMEEMPIFVECWQALKKANIDLTYYKSFIEDFRGNADIVQRFLKGELDVKAWEILINRPQLRKTQEVLESMDNLLKNPNATSIFGSELEFQEALKKFTRTHESPKWSWNKSSLKYHLDLLDKHITEFQGVEGFDKSIKDAITNSNPSVQDGFWHGMNAMEKLGYKRADVKAFDMQFDETLDCGSPLNPAGCKFDLELNGTTPRYIEFKSYQNADEIPSKQFLAYISRLNSLDEMKYIFSAKKITVEKAKEGLKIFFNNATNKQNIWNSMSNNLKGDLLGTENANRFDLFESKINDTNSNLYNFILTK